MSLKHTQRVFEQVGQTDPLYAVLSAKENKGNKWNEEQFFATGRKDINSELEYIGKLGLDFGSSAALDFGCGVGRLTQALAEEFETVSGVDISSSMIEHANSFNRFGTRCRYYVNTTDDLTLFEDATFDFVYTVLVLQHMHPSVSSRYIKEFFRIVKPGGVVWFQIPSGPDYPPGGLREMFYDFTHGPLKRSWKRIRGKPPVEMNYINVDRVKGIITDAGGKLVEARQCGRKRMTRVSYQYCATRKLDSNE